MATGGSINASDEIINIKCCICDKKNTRREADKYCIDCQDYYCTTCADMHKMFLPASSEHKLLDKTDFGKVGLTSALPSFPTERCSLHQAKLLDMYCKDHDEVICTTCVALTHRKCQDIHSIPDEIDQLYQPAASDELKSQLIAVKKTMEDIKKTKKNLVEELKKYRKKATDSVREFRKEIEGILDKLETESVREIDEMYSNIEADLQKDIKEVEKYVTSLELSVSNLEKSGGNKAQEFICIKYAEKNIDQAKKAKTILDETKDVEIVFQANSQIKGSIQKMDKFGKVCTTESMYKLRNSVYIVKSEKEIFAKHTTEKNDCWMGGSCFTSDSYLLLTDYSNKNLKRVDVSSGLIKDYLELKGGCTGVCLISQQEAAVCLGNNTIQFVSLGDKMVPTQQLKLDHECYGLAYNNNKLFISDIKATVYIHDMKGNMLHKISSDKFGNSLFSDSRHITVVADRVYIADNHKGLIVLDTRGNYKSTFTNPDLIDTQCVCTDGRGNIFVIGYGSSKTVQVNGDSQRVLGYFGTVAKSVSSCFDPNRNILVVTCYDSNNVKVYELE